MLLRKKNPELEIGRNSSLYFAIGLNLMLFFSWQALEYKTYEKREVAIDILTMEAKTEEEIPIVNYNAPPPPPPPVAFSESIQIVDDVVEIEETVIESSETNQNEAISDNKNIVGIGDVKVAVVEEDVEVAFAVIEDVPVFPGCEGLSKSETKDCFQRKIQEHVVKNFHYPETALQLSIQGRVSVMFIVDSKGVTTGIRSRGPDKILEKEAERIIGLLPKMQPGKQRGRPVRVAYAVPIFFKYQER
ncbi:energy transducer TonB [Mariniflexile litorale]|uniref:Energy transducer TonB n=1 Tax=Mariniflexile litorale TaxID=3045158 RepID=A0AAU7EDL0_9FLAO|nr:energy transducer TonB [Mariniflexile sp. KMM 9835]MDQ8212854.1 energy transducer TonB [Mariniflexile sp. KMM 9835]